MWIAMPDAVPDTVPECHAKCHAGYSEQDLNPTMSFKKTYRRFAIASLLSLPAWLLILSLSLPDRVMARQVEQDLERILDEFEPVEADAVPEEQIQRIFDLAANPLNINRAGVEELMQVPGMTRTIASAIVAYRNEVKPFESTDELTRVRGIGTVRRNRFQPYLTVGTPQEMRRDVWLQPRTWVYNGRAELTGRYRRDLDLADGYRRPESEGGYAGSPVNLWQRYHYRSRHLSIHYAQVKHPGEPGSPPFRNGSTFHASIEQLGRLRTVVAGDYGVRFGQGLILGSSGVFGKGTEVIRAAGPGGSPLRGLSSASSPFDFRGAAFSYGERLNVTGFASSRKVTATEVSADTIRYPIASPRFRTATERDRAGNTTESAAGGRLTYQFGAGKVRSGKIESGPIGSGQIGLNGYVARFDQPIQAGSQPWQRHDFEGTAHSALSLDYSVELGPTHLFGEAGRTGNGGLGMITGMEAAAGDGTEFALLYRNYQPEFQSIFGNSFAEQSAPQNEEGWYMGVRQKLGDPFRLSFYVDQFRFPAPRYRIRRPSTGRDALVMLEVQPDRESEIHLLLRQKIQEQEYESVDDLGRTVRPTGEHRRHSARLHFSRQVLPHVRLRSRIEWVHVRLPAGDLQKGLLLWQDVRIQPSRNVTLDARIAFFETDGFEARFYHYENDLLYVISSRMLFDQGQRLYLLMTWNLSPRVRLWMKIGGTWYENRHEIGSGLSRIPRSWRREFGTQLQVRL